MVSFSRAAAAAVASTVAAGLLVVGPVAPPSAGLGDEPGAAGTAHRPGMRPPDQASWPRAGRVVLEPEADAPHRGCAGPVRTGDGDRVALVARPDSKGL